MLKPFYNKKKNIDNRLLPVVTADDAGKGLVVDENGNIVAEEVSGGNQLYEHIINVIYSNAQLVIISTDSIPMTKTEVVNFLQENDFTSSNKYYPLLTYALITTIGNETYLTEYIGVYTYDSNLILVYADINTSSFVRTQKTLTVYPEISDKVIAL